MLLAGLLCLAWGPSAYAAWRGLLGTPLSLGLHVLALVAALYHSLTWFQAMPKTAPDLPIAPQQMVRGGLLVRPVTRLLPFPARPAPGAALLLAFVFVAGPTVHLLEIPISATGDYPQHLLGMSLWLDLRADSHWQADWTLFWPLCHAPVAAAADRDGGPGHAAGRDLLPDLLGFGLARR